VLEVSPRADQASRTAASSRRRVSASGRAANRTVSSAEFSNCIVCSSSLISRLLIKLFLLS
jgi:hypothetical protein